jgi:hypothetical protein
LDWREIVDRRFEDREDWDVVGIVLSNKELQRRPKALARELVPGDILLAFSDEARPQAYVNLGDQFVPTRLKISRSR